LQPPDPRADRSDDAVAIETENHGRGEHGAGHMHRVMSWSNNMAGMIEHDSNLRRASHLDERDYRRRR
jgi:hypothetical protein